MSGPTPTPRPLAFWANLRALGSRHVCFVWNVDVFTFKVSSYGHSMRVTYEQALRNGGAWPDRKINRLVRYARRMERIGGGQ